LKGDLLVTFGNGKTAMYPASFLYDALSPKKPAQATEKARDKATIFGAEICNELISPFLRERTKADQPLSLPRGHFLGWIMALLVPEQPQSRTGDEPCKVRSMERLGKCSPAAPCVERRNQ
jgi:hypothetical protein